MLINFYPLPNNSKKKMASTTTTTRKRATAATVATATNADGTSNPRLELARAVNGLSQKMEAFSKTAEQLAAFTKDSLVEFDMQIQAKSEELNRLQEETEHTQKRMKTETNLFLAEYRYDGAKKILAERGEVPIASQELADLRTNLQRLSSERDKEIDAAIKTEKARSDAALHSAVSMRDLTHKATTAELTATTNQQIKEIASLNQTIANLKEEVAQQRKLTEAVANAGRQGPITLNTNGK